VEALLQGVEPGFQMGSCLELHSLKNL